MINDNKLTIHMFFSLMTTIYVLIRHKLKTFKLLVSILKDLFENQLVL